MTSTAPELPEQIALLDRDESDPSWTHRLSADDPVAQLADTFLINSQSTPVRTPVASLVPAELRGWASERLRAGVADVAALYRDMPGSGGGDSERPLLPVAHLGQVVGIALDALPAPYADWRLTTEVYFLTGRDLYQLVGEHAVRYKRLHDSELALAFSPRLLPVNIDVARLSGELAFVVAVPVRGAALGGLRGSRTALVAAGVALGALRAAAVEAQGRRWWWDTEFHDDAASRLLSVDGVERVVLAIGARIEAGTSEEDQP